MRRRYELSNKQWNQIKDLLPGRQDTVGVTARNNRRFVNGVMWILRSGSPWRDLPNRYGDWKNTHRRFSRWSKYGVWENIFKVLTKASDNRYISIDDIPSYNYLIEASAMREQVFPPKYI